LEFAKTESQFFSNPSICQATGRCARETAIFAEGNPPERLKVPLLVTTSEVIKRVTGRFNTLRLSILQSR